MGTFAQKTKAPQQATPAKPAIRDRAHFGQSQKVNSILHLQGTIGNQAVLRLLQTNAKELNTDSAITASTRFAHDFSRIPVHSSAPGGMQPKLMVNTPGDIYEQEADRIISEQVMTTPTHHAVSGVPPRLQRFSGQPTGQADAAPASVNQALASPGRPLEPTLRQDMEPRFGHDFSRVRVHSDAAAEQSARDVNAHAYTVGQNIVFGAGRFAPATSEGRHVLAHELTHVVQADSTASNPALQHSSVETLEREARRVAEAVGSADPVPPIRGSARGLMVPLRQGPDDPGRPTYSNLPRDVPDKSVPLGRVVLSEEGGVWYEERLGGKKFRAEGKYDFVMQKGKIWAVTVIRSVKIGGPNRGHTEAAAGGPVEYAGTVSFGTRQATRGVVLEWSNASGHYAPVGEPLADEKLFAKAAGLPMDRFKPVTEGFPEKGSQLPVFQPQTRSREGRPPKVPPGPPRLGELEAYLRALKPTKPTGGAPPSSTSTSGAGGGQSTPPTSAAAKTTTASTGAPLGPVVEATPGFNPGRGAVIGGGVQALNSWLGGSIRGAEMAKAVARYAELAPEITRLLKEGNTVTVTIEVEVPTIFQLGLVNDVSQVVYYRYMYIKSATKPLPPSAGKSGSAATMYPVGGEIREDFGDPHRWDKDELTLDQSIRAQDLFGMKGDPDPAKKHEPQRPTHRIMTRDQIFTPSILTSPPMVQTQPPLPLTKPKPQLDEATKKALAAAPSRVYVLSENITQYKTAYEVIKKLAGNPLFGEVKESMGGGGGRTRTIVSYRSDLDKAKAEALAEIVRSEGVSSVDAELSGDGNDAPGVLQIFFGRDAEK